jgi:predicted nuclease with TOPRIM domain
MRVTAKLEERHREFFDRIQEEEEIDSGAETIRRCLERGAAAEERVDELEGEVARLENERDDLLRQLREANKRQDEVTELVEYVDEERSLTQARRERESAPVWKRAKWWVTGYPTDEER